MASAQQTAELWDDAVAARVVAHVSAAAADDELAHPIVCASGISPSGQIHLGNLREVFTTHLVAEALRRQGHEVVHLHSWDDYDRFRKVPAGVDSSFEQYVGRPLASIPDPGGEYSSYADRYMDQFRSELEVLGIRMTERRQSELYPGRHLQRGDPPCDGRARAGVRHARRAADGGSPRDLARGAAARVLPVQAVLHRLFSR